MKILQAGTFVFQKCWITTLLDNLFMSCGVLQPDRLRTVQRGLGALPPTSTMQCGTTWPCLRRLRCLKVFRFARDQIFLDLCVLPPVNRAPNRLPVFSALALDIPPFLASILAAVNVLAFLCHNMYSFLKAYDGLNA